MRLLLFALIILPGVLLGQDSVRRSPDTFVSALLAEGDSSQLCIDDSALAASRRLGISYEGVAQKCLISYDLDDSVKARLRSHELKYSTTLVPCGHGYDRLTLNIPEIGLSKDFYFRDGCMTSPLFYFSSGWKTITTRFFTFVMSDPSLTNTEAIDQLEEFLLRSGSILGFSKADYRVLEHNKILYYLCRDEDEIERLTGFRTRGMYNLAYDAIVSTYNAHFHELTHLLVNFKLRRTKLFEHPLLQEGLAVALGGRGGLDADVVNRLGSYLDESEMLRYTSLLRRSDFNSFDASLTYPAAGLYNLFLLEALGADGYLALYMRHCGAIGDESLETIAEGELPSKEKWASFLIRYRRDTSIRLRTPGSDDRLLCRSDSTELYENRQDFVFLLRHSMVLGPRSVSADYRSSKFSELFPDAVYNGQRYACIADSQSVSVYDLATNTLIANYVASFTIPALMVPNDRGMFSFAVPKAVFRGSLK
jgi:hypothetical protein